MTCPKSAASREVQIELPSRYSLFVGSGALHTAAQLASGLTLESAGVEAGKAVSVTYVPEGAPPEARAAGLEARLRYRFGAGAEELAILRSHPDPVPERLCFKGGPLLPPPDAQGPLELRFGLRAGQGASAWEEGPYRADLIPSKQTALHFDGDFRHRALGALRGGEGLRIVYDPQRLRGALGDQWLGGHGNTLALRAFVSFDDRPPLALALTRYDSGDRLVAVAQAVAIPPGTRKVSLWFWGRGFGSSRYDSAFGRNYTFEVEA